MTLGTLGIILFYIIIAIIILQGTRFLSKNDWDISEMNPVYWVVYGLSVMFGLITIISLIDNHKDMIIF